MNEVCPFKNLHIYCYCLPLHANKPCRHPEYEMLLSSDSIIAPVRADGDGEKCRVRTRAANRSIGSTTGCTITEKAPTRAFSWWKAATTAFTFKTLLRHYAKQVLTPRFLNMKLGPRRNFHKGRPGW